MGGSDMYMPKGYYTGQVYVGFLPNGIRMSFPTQTEYQEYIEDMTDLDDSLELQ